MENVFIGISGIIGAGKTTLAAELGKVLNLPVYYEDVIDMTNAYMDSFYKDMARYSFPLQIHLLNKRFRQHQQIIWQGKGGVQDRTIYEDSIFARMLCDSGLMDKRDFDTYSELFSNMSNFMRKPNLIVHLDVSPEESLERIKSRNRSMETSITIEYLTNLKNAYDRFLHEISRVIPVIKVDWSDFQDPEQVAALIKSEWEKMQNIHSIDFKGPQI